MEKIVINNQVKIKIICEQELNLKNHLSNYYQLKNGVSSDSDKSIRIMLGNKNQIVWEKQKGCITLFVTQLSKDVYNAINILLNVLIKITLQEKRIYILHASSVEIQNRDVILFGNSGSGKTATAIKLASNENVKFISNGSTIVSWNRKEIVVLGTYKKGIKLRKSTLAQLNPDLCNKLFDEELGESAYDCKILLKPEEMGFSNLGIDHLDTRSVEFYILQLEHSKNEILHNGLYDYKTAMMIYEDLTRDITAAEIYLSINGESIFVPSFDDKQLAIDRINFINFLLQNYYKGVLVGDINMIEKKLLENM